MGQKRAGFVFVERTESSLLGAGEDTGLRGIITNIPVALRLSQCAVKDAVNAFYGFRGQWGRIIDDRSISPDRIPIWIFSYHAATATPQHVIKTLDIVRGKHIQSDGSQGGLDVVFNVVSIDAGCCGFYAEKVIGLPDVQP